MKHLNLLIILLTHFHPIFYPSHIATNKNFQFFFHLIDNIFCNVTFNSNITSGNFTSTVSAHLLPQFAIIEDFFAKSPKSKSNIFKRNWKNVDRNLFISDFEKASWDEIIDVNKKYVNLTLSSYL